MGREAIRQGRLRMGKLESLGHLQPMKEEQIISHPAYARIYLYQVVIAIVLKTGSIDTRTLPAHWGSWKYLLLGRVVGKVDALLDVGLETLDSLAQELLLPLGDALQGVGDLFDTVGLRSVSLYH